MGLDQTGLAGLGWVAVLANCWLLGVLYAAWQVGWEESPHPSDVQESGWCASTEYGDWTMESTARLLVRSLLSPYSIWVFGSDWGCSTVIAATYCG